MRKSLSVSTDSAQMPASSHAGQLWLPTFFYEQQLWAKGLGAVAGVDEVGRGALAGPVVAGAVIIDPATLENPLWSCATANCFRRAGESNWPEKS
jgi:hypothetical protein